MVVTVVLAAGFGHGEQVLLGRVVLAFALCFVLGFERELRGAPAGDRTFAMVGTAAAAVTAVAFLEAPQVVAGVITGIGFIGGGLVFRSGGMVKGITSAATLFTAVAIGIVAGAGHSWLAAFVAVLVLLDLEIRHLPVLRHLDARRYAGRVHDDEDMPEASGH